MCQIEEFAHGTHWYRFCLEYFGRRGWGENEVVEVGIDLTISSNSLISSLKARISCWCFTSWKFEQYKGLSHFEAVGTVIWLDQHNPCVQPRGRMMLSL